MSVLLFAYVCMLTAFETLSLLSNLVNKESESESELVRWARRVLFAPVSTPCTFCHSFASNTVTYLFLSSLCVVCARAHVFLRA